MAEIKGLRDTTLQTILNPDAALADGARQAGDYDNSTELDLLADFYLDVMYDTSAPSAGDEVAELYILPGDGEVTPEYPEGGDGTTGSDFDPQDAFYVGSFVAVNPGTGAHEIVGLPGVPLYFGNNRIVLKNVSGQTFSEEWELRMKPSKYQSV